jgi:Transposase DNA-binding
MERRDLGMEAVMSGNSWEPDDWAEREFGECELGDKRRVKRLVRVAARVTDLPGESTPNQMEKWSKLKPAYRLFNEADVTFQGIIAPHCRRTRQAGKPGDVMLILNDTTDIDHSSHRSTKGLQPIGNGFGRGFYLHSALMVKAHTGRVVGMAGQEVFHRKPRKGKPNSRKVRNSADRESAVWGRLFDRVGSPPPGVEWVHVCDRGADDFEVMSRALYHGCGFVIRAAKLNRTVLAPDGRKMSLNELLTELPACGTRTVRVAANQKTEARTAKVELRYGEVLVPRPKDTTPWLREHGSQEPLRLRVVELREVSPPKGQKAIRWVLYTAGPVHSVDDANRIIEYYEQRPTVEEYHKAIKTGCSVEKRQYRTVEALERVTGLLSICAVRLLQMKTAAEETPDEPARKFVPRLWIEVLQGLEHLPTSRNPTIREFVRALAGLGGHLRRKCDGKPGWITIWRGYQKLRQILRGVALERKRSG